MKCLGIDFGLKRVGLAVSDPQGKMAFPLKTIHRGTREDLFNEIIEIINSLGIEAIVLGLPLGPEGQESLSCRQIQNFRISLERRTAVPVHIINEACTSHEAELILKGRGVRGKNLKDQLDQAAAVLILDSFLAGRQSAGEG
ncbi:Holliday junction resolvase RuvX [Desulfonatronospira sp.]|uniref:Holliday junction resolvase RuvX n=1 Tax=Desulfonatronospira sp. TaxID=1962951 RepID=UPI0025BDCF40|nr:Holliday junction resolvase RuvX [Desulfonatronospira sp.]